MLIEENELEISCSQWHPGDEEWVARVSVSSDLTPAMPYINAVARNPEYVPEVPVIIWRDGEHQVALRPHEIAINHLADREAAGEKAREAVTWLNELWGSRGGIAPRHDPRTPPPLMSVLKLLPRNNCRECGLATCTAYAVQLIEGEKKIADCPAMAAAENAQSAEKLRNLGLS